MNDRSRPATPDTAIRFGVNLPQQHLEWPELLRRVRVLEQLGFDGAWVMDHFQVLDGSRPGSCLESWSLLPALAAATSRIRLGVLVTGVTYRHPSILAAQAVTVDHISAGRLELGLGAGWHEGEHRALGLRLPPVRERAGRLEEAVILIRKLMTEEDATFSGRYYCLLGANYRPWPVQRPHPPIWIGAGGEQLMLPIVARHADVWHGPNMASVHEFRRKSMLLDQLARTAGRDPARILRSASLRLGEPWDEVRRAAADLVEAGAGYIMLTWPTDETWLTEYAVRLMREFA